MVSSGSGEKSHALYEKAEAFAAELAETLAAFTNADVEFGAEYADERIVIAPKDGHIELNAGGVTHLSLVIQIDATWDSGGEFLAIEESRFQVFAGTKINKEPLFRYEFLRGVTGWVPSAHLHVHAHRDEFTHALSSAGRASRKGKRHERRPPDDTPFLATFHFPLGGARFRPCLEDVLDALQQEFGLEAGPEWPATLRRARIAWRRKQLAAAVRDCPEVAAEVLQQLGLTVEGELPGCAEHKLAAP